MLKVSHNMKIKCLLNALVQPIGEPSPKRTLWIHRPVGWADPFELPNKGEFFLSRRGEGLDIWKATCDARHMGDPDVWEITATFIPGRTATKVQIEAFEAAVSRFEAALKSGGGVTSNCTTGK